MGEKRRYSQGQTLQAERQGNVQIANIPD